MYSPTRSRILDSLFAEAVRVRSSGYGSLVEELELPERAGGAGDAPVEPSGPVPTEQRREGHRGAVAPRRDAPEGSELGRQPAGGGRRSWAVEERRLLRALGDALDTADGDAFTFAPDLEGAIGAERKHKAGRGRKEEGYICHFIDISYSTRLEMTFLIGSVCCRPNIDFVVCVRQFQL